MNPDKLKKLQAQVRIGGKGTPRRKKKVVHQVAGADDKKLQGVLKKINISPIAGIEDANMIKSDGTVIHFNNPKVQASLSANTFAITGHGEIKRAQDFLPGFLSQLENSDFRTWGQLANELAAKTKLAAAEDDDVPDLVENFEEVAKKDELESITKKTEEIAVA